MNHAAKGITDKDFALAKKIEDVIQLAAGQGGRPLEGTPNGRPALRLHQVRLPDARPWRRPDAPKRLRRDVACPFCGLACDDLEIAGREQGADGPAAALARSAARASSAPLSDRGRRAGRRRALRSRRGHRRRPPRSCAQSRQPLFAGLATDVAGLRGVLRARRSHWAASSIIWDRRRALPQPAGAPGQRRDDDDAERSPQSRRPRADRRARPVAAVPALSRALRATAPTLLRRGPASKRRPRSGSARPVGRAAGAAKGVRYSAYPPARRKRLAPTVGRSPCNV